MLYMSIFTIGMLGLKLIRLAEPKPNQTSGIPDIKRTCLGRPNGIS